jgi:hypothetical protein
MEKPNQKSTFREMPKRLCISLDFLVSQLRGHAQQLQIHDHNYNALEFTFHS